MSLSRGFAAEARENLRLALPLIAAQLTFVGTGVLDVLMAGRVGQSALAAVAVGANVWVMVLIFFMGLFIACSPIVAQRVGRGEAPAQTGAFVREAVWLALPLGAGWVLLLQLAAQPVIDLLGLQPDTAALAVAYLRAESWAGLLICACVALRSSAEGLGLPRVALLAGSAGLLAKAAANYALMFGHWGAPALGAVGAGWGTVVASAAMLATYVMQYAYARRLRGLALFAGPWPRYSAQSAEIFRLGLPIALILWAEAAFFCVTALLMARFGDTTVAAHQVAINAASIVFMVPLGIGLATTVRVGHAAGAGSGDVRLRGQTGMGLGLAFALLSAGCMALRPDWIVALYTGDEAIAAPARQFLRFAAMFQLFDCLQATANGALRGIKDTRVPMLITLAAYWLAGLPFGYALAFAAGQGPVALWWGFNVGLALAAGGLAWRFLRQTRPQIATV